jgi:DNA repair photolyase
MEPSFTKYNQVEAKSILNKSGLSDYAVNCYTGCGHRCVYCYARFATRFTHPHEDWGSSVDIKANAPEVLAREVKRRPVGHVMLSSVCDGWQPIEKSTMLTRRCLEILVHYRYPISVLTKNALAGRDPKLAGLIEPGASPPQERLEILQAAKSKGIKTYAFIGPLLPFLSDNEQNVTALLTALKDIGVDYFYVDKCNLRYGTWPALLKMLQKHYPALIQEYRKIYFQDAAKDAYISSLSTSVNTIARKMGVDDKMNLCI